MRHKTMMIERIRPWVQGKKVLILGFGREGKSTWNVLKKLDCCSFVDVADMAEPKEKPEGIRNWIAGPDYQKCLNEYDVVFKSPGVVLEKPVQSYSSQILSQTELFFQCFRDQIIGITGTKGNSHIFQLVTGKFTYDLCVLSHFFHMIKHRNTNVSYQDRIHPCFL